MPVRLNKEEQLWRPTTMPLNQLWQESNTYQDYDWKCLEDSMKFKQILEKNKVFDFFGGFKSETWLGP